MLTCLIPEKIIVSFWVERKFRNIKLLVTIARLPVFPHCSSWEPIIISGKSLCSFFCQASLAQPRGFVLSKNKIEAQKFGYKVESNSSISHCFRGNTKYKGVKIKTISLEKRLECNIHVPLWQKSQVAPLLTWLIESNPSAQGWCTKTTFISA